MAVTVIVGMQWGDEGKGKIIDLISENADIIARYQGGHNAGHTINIKNKSYILHLIPSGVLHAGKKCVIGNGVVIDPQALVKEIEELQKVGVTVNKDNLFISDRAHMILPYHQIYDRGDEDRKGKEKIGTTGRGIGPSYGDKISRNGFRIGELLDPETFREKLKNNIDERNFILEKVYDHPGFKYEDIYREFMEYAEKFSGYITDTGAMLREAINRKENILCEGAQGTMLDIDYGTYPFVTSSNSTSSGVCTGLGINPKAIDKVLGVSKVYTTRVGEGPFPSELLREEGELLRERGKEYGATTGRPRRCGWFDAVVARYASWINGLDRLLLTKLDILDHYPKIPICTGYEFNGKVIEEFPHSIKILNNCKPVYIEMDGWLSETKGITSFEQLPANAKKYIEKISSLTDREVSLISTGNKRGEEIILKEDFF